MPKILQHIRRLAPGASVRSVAASVDHIERGLGAGEIDLAVGYFPRPARQGVRSGSRSSTPSSVTFITSRSTDAQRCRASARLDPLGFRPLLNTARCRASCPRRATSRRGAASSPGGPAQLGGPRPCRWTRFEGREMRIVARLRADGGLVADSPRTTQLRAARAVGGARTLLRITHRDDRQPVRGRSRCSRPTGACASWESADSRRSGACPRNCSTSIREDASTLLEDQGSKLASALRSGRQIGEVVHTATLDRQTAQQARCNSPTIRARDSPGALRRRAAGC